MIKDIGAFAGLAAFFGVAVLALLSFTQGRDLRRLRDWAGSAPERDADRKETTSAAAAERAEEMRGLEEARTEEREAAELRETRRERREAGLPELTRGERLRAAFSTEGRSPLVYWSPPSSLSSSSSAASATPSPAASAETTRGAAAGSSRRA